MNERSYKSSRPTSTPNPRRLPSTDASARTTPPSRHAPRAEQGNRPERVRDRPPRDFSASDSPHVANPWGQTPAATINHPALNVAITAARSAGRIINIASNHLERINIERKGPADYVSEVDRQAEDAIIALIQQNFPHHCILGEERGALSAVSPNTATPSKEEYLWIIDPLDGTTNFLHGFPQYAISIALYHRQRAEVAVIFDPTKNELFTAIRGRGALLNQQRLRVSMRHQWAEVLMGTGFPFKNQDTVPEYLKQMEAIMRVAAGIRRAGSAALDLAYVAAGRLDGFWEHRLSPWDVAAGALLVQEAGGIVSEINGGANWLKSGSVLCANASLHEKIRKKFATLIS